MLKFLGLIVKSALIIEVIINFLMNLGGLGVVICFILVYGGLVYIGIYLKSREIFESDLYRIIFGIGFGILGLLLTSIIYELIGGFIGTIVGIISMGITLGIAEKIAGKDEGWVSIGTILLITWWIIGSIGDALMLGIIATIAWWIVGSIIGLFIEGLMLSIAESKFNEAIKYLKNGDIDTAIDYLSQSY